MIFKKAPAFTLVELLVVIAILAILAMIIVVAVSTNQTAKARDAVRKAHLSAIASALTTYEVDHGGVYPPPPPDTGNEFTSEAGSNDWIPGLAPDEIRTLPLDPKQAVIFNIIARLDKMFNKQQSSSWGEVASTGSISVFPNSNDCEFRFFSSTYPADPDGLTNYFGCSVYTNVIGQTDQNPDPPQYVVVNRPYRSSRAYFDFDTSEIPDNAIITGANLRLSLIHSTNYPNIAPFNILVRNKNWTFPPGTPAYWTFTPGAAGVADYWSTQVPPPDPLLGSYNTQLIPQPLLSEETININLNSNLETINKVGLTKMVLSSDREENNLVPAQDEMISIYSTYYPYISQGEADRLKPELTVSYTISVGGVGGGGGSAPSPSPSPPPPKKHHYGYYVSEDRKSYTLWSTLEFDGDEQINTKSTAECQEPTPVGTSFNYCMKSP